MQLSLTAQEQEHLVWNPGDWYEIISGSITFVGAQKGKVPSTGLPYTLRTFFFECNDPTWSTQEWTLATEQELPNGPSMLVLLRRGNEGAVFGIVSMVNRSWTHLMPIDASPLISNSEKMKKVARMQLGTIAKGLIKSLPMAAIPVFGALAMEKKAERNAQPFHDHINQIAATARTLMFRISKDADKFWEGGGGNTGGKL